MSLSRPLRTALTALALSSAVALGACSFQPVYSGRLAETAQMPLAYAAPAGRLEQIVYAELALRFGRTTAPTSPLAAVSLSTSTRTPYLSVTANPNTPYETTVTATLTVTPRDGAGGRPVTVTRTATAQFTRSGQVLADTAAETEAQERAAKAVAESLRLAVLAALAR